MSVKKISFSKSYKNPRIITEMIKAINYDLSLVNQIGTITTPKGKVITCDDNYSNIWDLIAQDYRSNNSYPIYCYRCGGSGKLPAFYYYAEGNCFKCGGQPKSIEYIKVRDAFYGVITIQEIEKEKIFNELIHSLYEYKTNKISEIISVDLEQEWINKYSWNFAIRKCLNFKEDLINYKLVAKNEILINEKKVLFIIQLEVLQELFILANEAIQKFLDNKKLSNHVGIIGEKTKFENLTVMKQRTFETEFGTGKVWTLKDKEGNVFTKFGEIGNQFIVEVHPDNKIYYDYSGEQCPQSVYEKDIVSFIADIKQHTIYNDQKQTVLGRCCKIKTVQTKKIKIVEVN